MPAPVASGWSGRRAGLAPAGKPPPCHGARGVQTFANPVTNGKIAPKAAHLRTGIELAESEVNQRPRPGSKCVVAAAKTTHDRG